jgi:hypothetical protein
MGREKGGRKCGGRENKNLLRIHKQSTREEKGSLGEEGGSWEG